MATDYTNKEKSKTYSEGIVSDKLGLRPVILDVLGDVKGKTILDLGCGSGKYSIVFAEMGAKVTGIDVSKEQIELAQELHQHESIKYMFGNAKELISKEKFDIVFMNMVVPDVAGPDILKGLFGLANTVVEERFVFTALHPLYLCPSSSTLDSPISSFEPKNYFVEGITYQSKAITEEGNEMHFSETHYSLSFLSKLLSESGFVIKQLYESKAIPERDSYFPIYLIFDCVKV